MKKGRAAGSANAGAGGEAPDDVPTFQIGANVLAKWGRSWYLSHVCGVQGLGKFAVYDVYCPVHETVKTKLIIPRNVLNKYKKIVIKIDIAKNLYPSE